MPQHTPSTAAQLKALATKTCILGKKDYFDRIVLVDPPTEFVDNWRKMDRQGFEFQQKIIPSYEVRTTRVDFPASNPINHRYHIYVHDNSKDILDLESYLLGHRTVDKFEDAVKLHYSVCDYLKTLGRK